MLAVLGVVMRVQVRARACVCAWPGACVCAWPCGYAWPGACVGVRRRVCVGVRRDEDIRDEEWGRGHST